MKFSVVCIFLLMVTGLSELPAQQKVSGSLTARQVIAQIQKNLTCRWNEETVDTFKSGNPDNAVTGIATCMFANMETLHQAVANHCNLIIAHEPTFYGHLDQTEMLEKDPVFIQKMEYINKHGLIIFRFHDHWHMTEPDGIYKGMVDQLGWKEYQTDASMTYFKFKEQTVGDFAKVLENKLNGMPVRIVGDPAMRFTNVALSVGAPGSRAHIHMLNNHETQVLVAGEGQEWETYQYVLDASMLGMKKAAIFTGHIPSEEAGMEYCAQWLSTFIKDTKVIFIKNNPAYGVIPMN